MQLFWLEELCDDDVRAGKETFTASERVLGLGYGGAVNYFLLCCCVDYR